VRGKTNRYPLAPPPLSPFLSILPLSKFFFSESSEPPPVLVAVGDRASLPRARCTYFVTT